MSDWRAVTVVEFYSGIHIRSKNGVTPNASVFAEAGDRFWGEHEASK